MAEVTNPIVLDSTAQRIATALEKISNEPKVSVSTTDIGEDSALTSGELYIVVSS